ncbi:MAG TPA: BA14K family protein [Pseudolabrys sp.]|nr:BA14K family protein [Pseudolabrys sp.]
MRGFKKSIAPILIATVVAAGMTSAARATPLLSAGKALTSAVQSETLPVRWRGHRGSGGVGAGIAAGILGGLILGGIAASQGPYYYGPGYYYGPPPGYYYGPGYAGDWMAYCASRYRSFDPASGTYVGYDGRRHYCR